MTILERCYQDYLTTQDLEAFVARTAERYTASTLARLAEFGTRTQRRAAVLALGHLGDYDMNPVLGRLLVDDDRGVRMLAESGLRMVWCRAGTHEQQQRLAVIIRLNTSGQFDDAARQATALLAEAATFAEVWNQRAIALFSTGRYRESARDCLRCVELNPYHFAAVAGLGQCQLQLGDDERALAYFRRALAMHPDLEGIRANVAMLERRLKRREH